MLNSIYTQQEWFDRLLPEGVPIPSTTLLSGPGGSGKPLIGNVLVAAWLRQGGSVVFMSLQYPDRSFIASSLKSVTQLDLDDYQDRIAFIELDASLEDMAPAAGNHFKANVVKPEVWDAALARACGMVPAQGPGILVFASALNLLLFSPTYGRVILEKIKSTIGAHKCTYLFSTSTTAKAEEIAELEATADNLVMTRSERQPFRLYMQIKRMKNATFLPGEIEVPIPANVLLEVKEIADYSRKRIIPMISKI